MAFITQLGLPVVGVSNNAGIGTAIHSPKKLHRRERKKKPSIAANLFQRKEKKKKKKEEPPKEVCKNMIA